MVTTQYAVCPFCGKTTPINKATFKAGNPQDLGLLQTRECRGKKGFLLVGNTSLRGHANEYQGLLSEMFDMASGIFVVLSQDKDLSNLITTPYFLKKHRQISVELATFKANEKNHLLVLHRQDTEVKRFEELYRKANNLANSKALRLSKLMSEYDILQTENTRLGAVILRLKSELEASQGDVEAQGHTIRDFQSKALIHKEF